MHTNAVQLLGDFYKDPHRKKLLDALWMLKIQSHAPISVSYLGSKFGSSRHIATPSLPGIRVFGKTRVARLFTFVYWLVRVLFLF